RRGGRARRRLRHEVVGRVLLEETSLPYDARGLWSTVEGGGVVRKLERVPDRLPVIVGDGLVVVPLRVALEVDVPELVRVEEVLLGHRAEVLDRHVEVLGPRLRVRAEVLDLELRPREGMVRRAEQAELDV